MKRQNIQKVLQTNPFKTYILKLIIQFKKKEKNESERPVKWKKYYDLIDKALANYKECESENCSCYKKYLFKSLQ